jgi:hypothetical protein
MVNLKINNSKPVQENFLGNGAVHHGFAGMPDDAGRVYTQEQCVIESNRVADMKLKIARTYYKWWAWDEKTNTWDWDNEIMTAFYKWLQRMKDGGVTVALNTGWWCPGDILSNFHGGISPFTVKDDWKASVQNYADWVSETVYQLVEVRGFTNVKILVLFTEPQDLKNKTASYQNWFDCSKAAHNALVRDGRRHLVKLMGPNEGSTATSEMVRWACEKSNEFIDIYSSHNYEYDRTVQYSFVKSGKGVVSISNAGGRVCRTISIKPNTSYIAYADVFLQKHNNSNHNGIIHFGVFQNNNSNDIHATDGFGPNYPLVKGSFVSIHPKNLDEEYQRISFEFNSGDNTSGVIGYFHDVKTTATSVIDLIGLKEKGSEENMVPNGCFENYFDGWQVPFAGCIADSYYDFYKWSKTGLQYVPEGKQYCFDEYNSAHTRDYSYDSHGAEICTAAIALMNSGVQFSLLWTLFDHQWPNNHTSGWNNFFDGDHRFGLAPNLTRSLIPHKSYYAFTLISKYVDGMGTAVYEGFGEGCLHTTMSVSPDGEITVIIVNCKDIDDEFILDFDKPLNSVNLNRHSFDPKICVPDEKAEIIGIDKVFEKVSTSLSDKISAYGVNVYTTHMD